jgi:hypothetical protein
MLETTHKYGRMLLVRHPYSHPMPLHAFSFFSVCITMSVACISWNACVFWTFRPSHSRNAFRTPRLFLSSAYGRCFLIKLVHLFTWFRCKINVTVELNNIISLSSRHLNAEELRGFFKISRLLKRILFPVFRLCHCVVRSFIADVSETKPTDTEATKRMPRKYFTIRHFPDRMK